MRPAAQIVKNFLQNNLQFRYKDTTKGEQKPCTP
jgi:hypothetical protein